MPFKHSHWKQAVRSELPAGVLMSGPQRKPSQMIKNEWRNDASV